jgi:hypothetical protein
VSASFPFGGTETKTLSIDIEKIKKQTNKIEKIQKLAHEDLLSGRSSLDNAAAKLDSPTNFNKVSKSELQTI